MNILELGAIGELVGGLAVIASLLYVGAQVRQGNRQARELWAREVAGQFDRWSEMIVTQPKARQMWRIAIGDAPKRSLRNPANLDDDDLVVFSLVLYRAFHQFSSQYKAWRSGLLSDAEWGQIVPLLQINLYSEAGKDYWDWARQGWFDAEFTSYVDAQARTLRGDEA